MTHVFDEHFHQTTVHKTNAVWLGPIQQGYLFMFLFRLNNKGFYCNSVITQFCMNYNGSEDIFLNIYKEKLKKSFGFAILFSFIEIHLLDKFSFVNGSVSCIISLISISSLSYYLVAKMCANFFSKFVFVFFIYLSHLLIIALN